MSKEEIEYCLGQLPNGCGRPLNKRWVHITGQHLLGLRYLAEYWHPAPMPLFELGRFFGGTGQAIYQAFHDLRWFGLVRHPLDEGGSEIYGLWLLTMRGQWFLAGEHEVPKKVRVYMAEVIERSPVTIGVEGVPNLRITRDWSITQMGTVNLEDIARAMRSRAKRRHIGNDDT
jgi:hypothetical protein